MKTVAAAPASRTGLPSELITIADRRSALGKAPVMHLFGTLAGLSMSLSAALTCLLVPAVLNKVGQSE